MSDLDFSQVESLSTTEATYFIAVYLLVLIYCCVALAVVCDVYFVPALQKLSYTYDLPPDIAGSTLMALGASVPELFASLIGVFVTEDDIGTGSVIGSSCFNLIAVPAACAFVASASFSKKLHISPMPVIRNSAFYAITILVLLLIIKDGKVDLLEACILLLFFVMYMALMIFSAQSRSRAAAAMATTRTDSFTSSCTSADSAISECHGNLGRNRSPVPRYAGGRSALVSGGYLAADERTPLVSAASNNRILINSLPTQAGTVAVTVLAAAADPAATGVVEGATTTTEQFNSGSVCLNLGLAIKNSTCLVKDQQAAEINKYPRGARALEFVSQASEQQQQKGYGVEEEEGEAENWVSSNWILVPMFPLTLSMKLLAPCKFKSTCWTIWTFLVSIALIGGLTYVSVWMVNLFGQTIGLPKTVSGMTILSWGTGIPELIASVVLIKKTAQVDMAICNTVGSNVIDISFCLSVPWIVKCILNKAEGLPAEVNIQSAALPWTSFTLVITVLLLILILKCHGWKLSVSVGVWLSVVYVGFVGVATYLESTYAECGLDLLTLM